MSKNICIYFSDTGGGHRGAADAVEGGLRSLLAKYAEKKDVVIIKDTVAEKSHPLNRFFVELYNYLLRHHQPLMKYYYSVLHWLRPESGLNYALTGKYFRNLLQADQPAVVVSVHPMISHCLAFAIKNNGLKNLVKLIVVVTDPNADLWRAWACPDADHIVAPNHVVKNRLIEWGVPAERVSLLGMPVHPSFVEPPSIDRRKFLTHLGLTAEALTICINAGWAGGGNMLKIYQALAKARRPLQCIFLCGHNTALYEKAMAAAAESNIPTAVLPFHDCMSDLMSSIDLMVTKAGGLTTYQAMARRLPILFDGITEPMPQERGTIDMLVAEKVAQSLSSAEEIIPIVENFQRPDRRFSSKLPKSFNLDLTDSAPYEIARLVLESCNPPIVLPAVAEMAMPPQAVTASVDSGSATAPPSSDHFFTE